MFTPDVIELRQFYASPRGANAARVIARALAEYWPDAPGETFISIGYALPFLPRYLKNAAQIVNLMPASQGAARYPAGESNRTALVDEASLPLHDNTVNRVLIVHGLENSESRRQMMAEAFRILTPGGRLLMVVPSRRGFWSRWPGSPFAHGQPFSRAQLAKLLEATGFTPLRRRKLLFAPPLEWRWILKSAMVWEWIGRRLMHSFGSLIVMEAEKQLYAMRQEKIPVRKTRIEGTLAPAASPRTGLKPLDDY